MNATTTQITLDDIDTKRTVGDHTNVEETTHMGDPVIQCADCGVAANPGSEDVLAAEPCEELITN
jgi:hypothetical protein